jgi:hypothetical protein
MKRRKSQDGAHGKGYSTQTGKKRKEKPKIKESQKESNRLYQYFYPL